MKFSDSAWKRGISWLISAMLTPSATSRLSTSVIVPHTRPSRNTGALKGFSLTNAGPVPASCSPPPPAASAPPAATPNTASATKIARDAWRRESTSQSSAERKTIIFSICMSWTVWWMPPTPCPD